MASRMRCARQRCAGSTIITCRTAASDTRDLIPRIYVPLDALAASGVSLEQLGRIRASAAAELPAQVAQPTVTPKAWLTARRWGRVAVDLRLLRSPKSR